MSKTGKVLTMPTNVTQKDETLKQVIDWCGRELGSLTWYLRTAYWLDDATKNWNSGKARAYEEVIGHCKSMLGYGGSMPLEVPNQSEDAK